MASRVPEGVFPRFLTDRGLDIRQPTIENQAHQVAKDVANYLANGGTITVIPPGTSGMVGEKGEYIANLGAWTTPIVQDKGEAAARKRQKYWARTGTAKDPILCDTCGQNAPWSSFRRHKCQQGPFTTCKPCRDAKRKAKHEAC